MVSASAITREGFEKKQQEFSDLTQEKLPKAIQRIQDALAEGATVENSDFEVAQEELALLNQRIEDLQDQLNRAELLPEERAAKDEIDLGSKVTVYIQGNQKEFDIVGELEANPIEKKISSNSPLGRALLGKKVGDQVNIDAPIGRLEYQILSIR